MTVMLAYLHPGMVSGDFMTSVLRMQDQDVEIAGGHSGPLLARSRNEMVDIFLSEDGFSHLWFVDSDMVFEPDVLEKMKSRDVPIVAPLMFGRNKADHATFVAAVRWVKDGKGIERIPKDEVTGLMEVAGVGMGCTLIRRDVLEALGVDRLQLWPFAERVFDDERFEMPTPAGEDLTFCFRANDEGFASYLDGEIRVGHVKTFVI